MKKIQKKSTTSTAQVGFFEIYKILNLKNVILIIEENENIQKSCATCAFLFNYFKYIYKLL
jgi:hypothetical protein